MEVFYERRKVQMLDFRMDTFLAVCRCMNFTKAAEELNITQPAVSHHIHYLEEHYQVKLFEYSGRRSDLRKRGGCFCRRRRRCSTTNCI